MGGELSKNIAISSDMREYFTSIQKDIDNCYKIANKARKKGFDPEFNVEIPQALDLAARVEELVGPKGIAPKIREFTKKIGNRELVSLEIAKEIVKEKKYKFKRTEDALDQAIRTGLAILTEGVLVAPLEGIAEIKIGNNSDGSNYVDLFFSGPIRSAGGTGQAMSVLIADVVRREMNIGKYIPTDGEVERYKEEIPLYKRVQHLQYTPSVDEIDRIVKGCPICIDGEGTEDEEVTGYRDLPRVGTNRLRGGACLVIAEGLCLKAPKILKHVKKLKLKGWEFLDIFVNKGNDKDKKAENGIPEIPPSTKYIGEVIAGRPVFSHPSRKGGFRLRYGRARTGGLASTAINPASMYILDGFIAVGTQLKTERPGKGTIGTPCTSVEGPIVLLQNGDLVQINDAKDIKKKKIKKIIDLGEILIPYGEFIENNSLLPDASYVYEWWIQDLQKNIDLLPKEYSILNIKEAEKKTIEKINNDIGREVYIKDPSWDDAVYISKKYGVPLHPKFNLFWHDISIDELVRLSDYIKENGQISDDTLVIPRNDEIKDILVILGALHKQQEGKIIFDKYTYSLISCCGLQIKENKIIESENIKIFHNSDNKDDILTLVSELSGLKIRARAPFRIGTRMGRPEKAAARKMRPPPHVLFPIGNFGGTQRLIKNAAELGKIEVEAGARLCPKCNIKTHRLFCTCGEHTKVGNGRIETQEINLAKELKLAQKNLKERSLPDTIKGVIGTISKNKTPEPLEKGILRAKYGIHVFKDGTTRFDMTDAPLTHFKPSEIGVSVNRLKELGYKNDYMGNEIENQDQICELKVQDVIISKACAEYFASVARFIDDLLTKFYGLDKFYKISKLRDLVGHLTVGLAPHTSAGSLSRIIGFTDAQVCYAHPFYHAAKRRNCLSPETEIITFNSHMPEMISLENFYNKIQTNERIVDDWGTKLKNIHGTFTYSLNPKNGKTVNRHIKSIIKIKAPNHLLKVKLKSGRDFISSHSHRALILSDGVIKSKKVIQLEKGDKCLTPSKLVLKDIDIDTIDLLIEFIRQDKDNNDIVVRGIKEFVSELINKIGGLKLTSNKLKINKKTLSNYIYRDSVAVSVLLKLLALSGNDLKSIPKNCKLGVKRDHTTIPRFICINEYFMRILGYYISEGYARSTIKSCYQICFSCSEKEMRNDLINCIKKIFNIKVNKDANSINIPNRLIYKFFIEILKIGKKAKEKRIPSRFYSLPKYKIKEILKSYFSGDGSVEKNRLHVTCSSVNKKLLRDIGLQLLRFGIFYRLKEETREASGIAKEFYDRKNQSPIFKLYYISIRSSYARKFCDDIGFSLKRKQKKLESVISKERAPRLQKYSDFIIDYIKDIKPLNSNCKYLYDVEVEGLHNFLINDFILTNNCDGDEDGLMLLLDSLINFSHSYIPDKRGGKMDLPLILTTRIDPSEVDKEAHNLDTLAQYPLEFYQATIKHEHSKELESKMGLVASRIGTDLQYENFGFTHDTIDISEGPKMSNYKTLKSMTDKMNAQLNLAAKIRAVDEADVAYKVIERHFLPDIIGNMRAFSKQSVRCPTCNITYRRPPLLGACNKCGGKLTLTVHEKSVKKYLEISKEIAKRYNISPYAQQRIVLVEKSINSLFMSDKIKTTKITDFL